MVEGCYGCESCELINRNNNNLKLLNNYLTCFIVFHNLHLSILRDMLKEIVVSVIGLFIFIESFSQEPLPDLLKTRESISETLEETQLMPEDFISLLDDLDVFRDNPLNLNQAGREELEKFIFLTDFQIQSLLDYRNDHGPFLTLYELQLVYGFDSLTIAHLLPFIIAGETVSDNHLRFENLTRYGKHEIVLKEQRILQASEGYIEEQNTDSTAGTANKYTGSRDRVLMKYRYHYRDRLFWGLTMEKDAGEEFFTGSNRKGFDFYSGYLQVNDMGPLKKILLGDFRVTAGQGLTLWSEPVFGKSPDPAALYKRQESLKKYGSTDENRFFRGIATSVALHNISLLAFVSLKSLDANITDTLSSGKPVFSSFRETGNHRILSEINSEKTIHETAAGGRLMFQNQHITIGSTLVGFAFSGTMQQPETPSGQYDFWGDRLVNAGFDYSLSFPKIQVYGETSRGNHAWATLNGVMLNVHHQVMFSLSYRYYEPGYYARYSGALSENSSATNENALYIGTVIHPFRHCKITAYADFFRFPWLTYSVQQPSSGTESLVQTDFNLSDNLEFYLRFRNKSQAISYKTENTIIKQTQKRVTNTIRMHCSISVCQNLKLRSRVEFKTIDNEVTGNANGFLLYQDFIYRFSKVPVQLSLRYLLFRTDDYTARIYAYEDDVLYSYSNPAFYDEGYRSYALIRYEASKNLTFWVKWGHVYFDDTSSIGTGLDEIQGNTKSEIKLQLRWVF
jgi:hypothetical protein